MKLNFSTLICVALLSTLSLIGQTSHLSNLSVLNQSGTGSNALTAGFTVGSGPAKQVLIRAIGPSLSTYGVNGVMADPSITIFDSAGNAIATNDNWDPSLANILIMIFVIGHWSLVIATLKMTNDQLLMTLNLFILLCKFLHGVNQYVNTGDWQCVIN